MEIPHGADPLTRLDADVVTEQLDRILPTLEQQRIGSEAKLVLALRLDAQQEISRPIRPASDQTIGLGDYDSQRRFIADALADSPRLVKVKGRDGGPESYKLTSSMITLEWRCAIAAMPRRCSSKWPTCCGGPRRSGRCVAFQ